MVLQSKERWEAWLRNACIPETEASTYAERLATDGIDDNCLSELTADVLKSLNITKPGDVMRLLKAAKNHGMVNATTRNVIPTPHHIKDVKTPTIMAQMTMSQFRKFLVDWKIYKEDYKIQTSLIPGKLYNACEESIQYHIIHAIPNFLELDEQEILNHIKKAVTKHSNPTVYRMNFQAVSQSTDQSCDDFIGQLRASAIDCEFDCPSCHYDLTPHYIRDRFIQGLSNSLLQTDILTKANTLKTLEDVTKHAKAFETALRDKSKLQHVQMAPGNDSVCAA